PILPSRFDREYRRSQESDSMTKQNPSRACHTLDLLAGLLAVIPVRSAHAPTTDPSQFEREVLPILSAHCFKCHGQDDPQTGLDLRTAVSVLKGSRSGAVIVTGASKKSLLFQKVSVTYVNHGLGETPTGEPDA